MSPDPDDALDDWLDGGDEDEPEPDEPDRPIGERPPPRRARPARDAPAGNVERADAAEARRVAAGRATGRLREPEQEWREELAAGQRGRAASRLSSRSPTHNAGSGFGLA